MDDDAARWDRRYRDQEPPVPVAPLALASRLDVVGRQGRALDVACGAGAESRWLAERGFDVVSLDVSPVAVELVRRAAGAVAGRVDARVIDLDHGLPADLGRFDVVVCQRFRQPAMYGELVDHLVDGGIAAVSVLSEVGVDGTPGRFHAPAGELLGAFDRPDVDVLEHVEADGLASIVIRRR